MVDKFEEVGIWPAALGCEAATEFIKLVLYKENEQFTSNISNDFSSDSTLFSPLHVGEFILILACNLQHVIEQKGSWPCRRELILKKSAEKGGAC